jgi:Cu-Zn family superoxide dismutase
MMLRKLVAAGLGLALALGLGLGCGQSPPLQAKATLVDSLGRKVGEATLTETPQGLKIVMQLENLPPGEHAFQIHENGVCATPDFESAGGLFHPQKQLPGLKDPAGPEPGYPAKITVGADGKAKVEVVAGLVSLKKGEKHSLLRPGGTSLVIRAGADANADNPGGQSAPRIACGVITPETNRPSSQEEASRPSRRP